MMWCPQNKLLTLNEITWPHSWCLSTGMSSALCKFSILEETFKQLLNLALHYATLCCSASMSISSCAAVQHYYVEHSERIWHSLFPWLSWGWAMYSFKKAWCYSRAHAAPVSELAALTWSPAGLGPLGDVLSARLVSLGQALGWFHYCVVSRVAFTVLVARWNDKQCQ